MIKNTVQIIVMLVFTGFATVTSAASVGTGGISTAFSKGSTSLGVVVGTGTSFSDDYIILGVGVGYYVLPGLELGLDVQHWFSGDPAITKVSPQVRYVFTQPKVIKPYVGAFYRRTFISDLDDADSYGYRAGAYFTANSGVYIGGGIVYEQYTDCDRFADCSTTYPELLFTVSF
jgi:hypothetical protein